MKFLEKLSQKHAFICLQEHWLWTSEKDYIDKHIPDMMNHSRCHDVNDPISNFQIPRGKGGAVLQSFDHHLWTLIIQERTQPDDSNWNDCDVNEKVNQLTSILHKTADKVVPKKLIKLTGFKNKASSKVRQLIQTSKQKHREWDNAGRPRNDHRLFMEKKSAKKALSRQQRKEAAIEREQFLQRLEKDPYDKAFFQLIK
ncbi:unnamed protein product [Mytilus coruscus]|uniref:Uncharacterized protein n=1 Tax=Mytilus coruscus TaxID=42192 RepID=A0A6J8E5D4_MYTCO|nr:unnamed protein product [Mytilus coruscus]